MLEFLQCLNLTLGKQYTQIFYSDLDAVDIKSMDKSSWVCKFAFSVRSTSQEIIEFNWLLL